MKILWLILVVCVLGVGLIYAEGDFKRAIPGDALLSQLTPEKFPAYDAIIVLRERGFQMLRSEAERLDITYTGLSSYSTNILIVKLLTHAAVERYGTFSYTYYEPYGDELPNGFVAHIRVKKPDGSIITVDEELLEPVTSRTNDEGDPIERRVLFKIPDLAAGDVLQIEYDAQDKFTVSPSEIFFYNEEDPVLFSNLFITLPAAADVRYMSEPLERVGEPKLQRMTNSYGAGDSRVWNLQKIPDVPSEPYAPPREDRSMFTAFVVEKFGINRTSIGNWGWLAETFAKKYLDGDNVAGSDIERLGFPASGPKPVTMDIVDRLYTALRKQFTIAMTSSIVPLSDDVRSLFEKRKGDASDLAYILLRILRKWDVRADAVWIRDSRDGVFYDDIPTLSWFDRIGVCVQIGETERVYDFEPTLPTAFEPPWFLVGQRLPLVREASSPILTFAPPPASIREQLTEQHHILAGGMTDCMTLRYNTSHASTLRKRLQRVGTDKVENEIVNLLTTHCLSRVDSIMQKEWLDSTHVTITSTGQPRAGVDSVDRLLTVNLRNHTIRQLRSAFNKPIRQADIRFPLPWTLDLSWDISIPPGYTIARTPPEGITSGPSSSTCTTRIVKKGESIRIEMTLQFPEQQIPAGEYTKLTGFLDTILETAEGSLVLKK